MVEVFVGQEGIAEVEMFDDDGRPTTRYDEIAGISYSTDNDEIVSVVDDDANPFDARFKFHRAHQPGEAPVRAHVTFDGAPGDPERLVELQSDEITVLEPPPGEAVSGTVAIRLFPVGS